jgi:hypothetical protein
MSATLTTTCNPRAIQNRICVLHALWRARMAGNRHACNAPSALGGQWGMQGNPQAAGSARPDSLGVCQQQARAVAEVRALQALRQLSFNLRPMQVKDRDFCLGSTVSQAAGTAVALGSLRGY